MSIVLFCKKINQAILMDACIEKRCFSKKCLAKEIHEKGVKMPESSVERISSVKQFEAMNKAVLSSVTPVADEKSVSFGVALKKQIHGSKQLPIDISNKRCRVGT